jgi:hypothetical protein
MGRDGSPLLALIRTFVFKAGASPAVVLQRTVSPKDLA